MDLALFFLVALDALSGAEQKRDTPQSRQGDHGKNNACRHRIRATADPSHNIKLENADASPIDGTENGKDQGNSIYDHTMILLFEHVGSFLLFERIVWLTHGILWSKKIWQYLSNKSGFA